LTERVVIKVGGATLFHANGRMNELRLLLNRHSDSQIWLLTGGGDLIEAMRTVHRIYPSLDEEEIHWRCVELLDHTWAIAKELLPAHSISSRDELFERAQECVTPGVHWVRVQSFYSRANWLQIPACWLPSPNWSTTTDALAWLLAKMIHANRVLLMKQCECNPAWTLGEAACLGVVDRELARLAALNPGNDPIVELFHDQ